MTQAVQAIEHSTGIGASELADVLNEGYGCRRKMTFRKRGVAQDYPTPGRSVLVMERGKALEELIARRYAQVTGYKVARRKPLRHPTLPLIASIDREIIVPGRPRGLLECKSHNRFVFARIRREGVPASHILQLSAYMYVTNRSWAEYAILEPESWEFMRFPLERDDSLIEAIIPQIEQAWKEVTIGPLPAALDPRDARCARCEWRRTCHGGLDGALMGTISAEDRKVPLERDESVAPLLADLQDAKTWAEEAGDVVEQIKERLRDAIGDRPGVECSGYRIYHREQVSKRIDTAGLRSRYPAIATELERSVTSRPLRIFPT